MKAQWGLAIVPAALAAMYAFSVWRIYRQVPAVRTRLGDEHLDLEPLEGAEGFERLALEIGSLLVPKGVKRRTAAQDAADKNGQRSHVAFQGKGRGSMIQVAVLPRRASSMHLLRLPWARTDGYELLESALTSRFSYFRVFMRSLLVRGQSDVSFARVTVGKMRGFVRRGMRRVDMQADTKARVNQFDLFDDAWHFKIDVVSSDDILSDQAALTVVASFQPRTTGTAVSKKPV